MKLNRVLSNWGEMTGYRKAPSTRISILFFEIGDFFLRFSPPFTRNPRKRFLKTPAYRLRVDGRKRWINSITLVGGECSHHCASHPFILGYNEVPQETWSNSSPKTVPPCYSTKFPLSFKRRHEMGSVTHKFSLHLTIVMLN